MRFYNAIKYVKGNQTTFIFILDIKQNFTSSHLHIINRIKFMRIWRAVRGEGSELGILARTQSTPLQIRTGIVVSAEKGWRRDAGKLPMNRGKSAVYTVSSTNIGTLGKYEQRQL